MFTDLGPLFPFLLLLFPFRFLFSRFFLISAIYLPYICHILPFHQVSRTSRGLEKCACTSLHLCIALVTPIDFSAEVMTYCQSQSQPAEIHGMNSLSLSDVTFLACFFVLYCSIADNCMLSILSLLRPTAALGIVLAEKTGHTVSLTVRRLRYSLSHNKIVLH